MKTTTLWLILMCGLAIVLVAVAVLVQDHSDAAGKVLAILSIIVGSLVAVGTKLFNNGKD
jgi:hypothetical protein